MPDMKSLQNLRLETTSGHVLVFTPDKPTYVPDSVVSEARKRGCVLVDGDEAQFEDDLSRARVDFSGELRQSLLFMAVKAVMAKNDPKDFDGAGIPTADAVGELVGFTVAGSEVPPVFQLWHQVEEGADYKPHANAERVQSVLEAESQAELIEIGKELGLSANQLKGNKTRELRKKLLIKLSGYTPE